MNIFNKIIMVILLISIILISFVAMVNAFVGFFEWSDVASGILEPVDNINNPFISALVLLLVLAVSIFILILEFYRRRPRVANVSTSKSGNAMMTLETIAVQIKASSAKIDGLKDQRVKIVPKSNGIIIHMQAKLDEGLELPEKMHEIMNDASSLVSEKLGIKVLKTNLTIVGLTSGKAKAEVEPMIVEEEVAPDKGKDIEVPKPEAVKPKPKKKVPKKPVKKNKD